MENTKNTNFNEESVEPVLQSKEDTVAVLTEKEEVENANNTVTETTDKSEVETATEATDNPKVETITEPKTVTTPEIAENAIEKTQVPNSISRCSGCGAVITSQQTFCPYCGAKNNVFIENHIANTPIQTFYEGNTINAKKKNGKIKILLIASSVVVVLAILVVAAFFYFNSKTENIIKEIEASNVSQSVIDDYNALTPIGQFFYRDKIIDTFVEQVADNPYSNDSPEEIVDIKLLDKYSEYKSFANTVGITDKDGTNVVTYIDTVLELNEYKEYYDVQKCVYNSISSYSDCVDYLKRADNSYYYAEDYLLAAYSAVGDAVEDAEKYNTGDKLCTEYIDALTIIEEEVHDLYWDGYYHNTSGLDTAFDTTSEILASLSNAFDAIDEIESNLPKIK